MNDHTHSRRNVLKFIGLGGITTAVAPGVLLQACREAASAGPALGFSTFNALQAKTLGAIQDAILPRTDTPSATDVGSVQFADTWLTHGYKAADRERFLYRLDKFTELAEADGADVENLTGAQVEALLDRYYVDYEPIEKETTEMEIEGNTVERKRSEALKEVTGGNASDDNIENAANEQVEEAIQYEDDGTEVNGLLADVRWMTLESYFQSEEVGENVLNYLEVPGGWDGDFPMSEVPNGRAWSL